MALIDTLFAFFVLTLIGLLIYLKMTKKTLKDFIIEIKEAFAERRTE